MGSLALIADKVRTTVVTSYLLTNLTLLVNTQDKTQ